MNDYMKEAGQLADAYAVAYMDFVRCGKSCHEEARTALLAHIQRGALPEGWQLVPIDPSPGMLDAAEAVDWGDEDTRGSCCNQWHAMLAAAPAPDHFRDAAEKVAEPLWPTDGVYPDMQPPATQRDRWMFDQGRLAERRIAATPTPAEVPTPDVVGYVERWGGACRDCADESGVCPSTGLPCGGQRKAIEYVIRALQYGVKHGYIANLFGAACRAAGEAAGYAQEAALKEGAQG